MNSQLRPVITAFLVLGLYGCGLKGPLFMPPAPKTTAKPAESHKLTTTDTSSQSPVQTANPGSNAPHSGDSVVP
ncbi:LPS translocon maturation chaperone LptM [Sodalis ligni]|uniref:LPS translocon maturation chaperone LptM n=1 Tax=Sodalis ligni TaxID=2697027 RepID=UPI0020977C9D|nr:lipoprotein [Sodalis ligni]